MNEIIIQKNTLILTIGLILSLIVGIQIVKGSQPIGQNVTANTTMSNGTLVHEVYLNINLSGYDKSQITVRRGVPVRLHFTAHNAGCGNQLVIYGLGVNAVSRGEEQIVEFTPEKEGTYEYNCGMRMFPPGKLIVVS